MVSVPTVRLVVAAEDLEQRRLAGAVLAEEGEHLAGPHVERDVVERLDVGEGLADVADLEDAGAAGGLGCGGLGRRGQGHGFTTWIAVRARGARFVAGPRDARFRAGLLRAVGQGDRGRTMSAYVVGANDRGRGDGVGSGSSTPLTTLSYSTWAAVCADVEAGDEQRRLEAAGLIGSPELAGLVGAQADAEDVVRRRHPGWRARSACPGRPRRCRRRRPSGSRRDGR